MLKPVFSFVEEIESSAKSVTLHYINDDDNLEKNLDEFCEKYSLTIPALTRENFLGKQSKITLHNAETEFYLKKMKKKEHTPDMFRDVTALFFNILPSNVEVVNIILPCHIEYDKTFKSSDYLYQSLIEGVYLGCYKFDRYLSDKTEGDLKINLIGGTLEERERTTKAASTVMDGVFLARELANEPASVLNPETFALKVKELFSSLPHCSVEIFDVEKLESMGMGGILAVGKGSVVPPRLVVIKYEHPEAVKSVALVGKGVTFDSGGISIKPAQNMGWMKADMSGAAAVTGTMLNIAKMEMPLRVFAALPLAENMLSGSAYRPGDIVTTYSKKTIEVDNTDAEGRIILADALTYAAEQKPEILIDLATLTGACAVALAEEAAGLMSKNDELAEELYKAGQETSELLWRLPLWDRYARYIKSDVADVKNTGGRYGGAITAGKFLEKFVKGHAAWAHIDMAGPAIANASTHYSKTWMTGFGVRLLTSFIGDIK